MITKLKMRLAQLRAIFSDSEPLIYATFEGQQVNLLLKDLNRKIEWEFSKDTIVFKEAYTLDGVVVKQGADIFKLPDGTVFNLMQGQLNG
jgi:Mg2+/Co2+ transporter CorB